MPRWIEGISAKGNSSLNFCVCPGGLKESVLKGIQTLISVYVFWIEGMGILELISVYAQVV